MKDDRGSDEVAYRLDVSLSILGSPGLRECWLPQGALAAPEATAVTPGREISYRMRDEAPPFLGSIVTSRIAANAAGGTSLRIIHVLDDARLGTAPAPANSNDSLLMRAA